MSKKQMETEMLVLDYLKRYKYGDPGNFISTERVRPPRGMTLKEIAFYVDYEKLAHILKKLKAKCWVNTKANHVLERNKKKVVEEYYITSLGEYSLRARAKGY